MMADCPLLMSHTDALIELPWSMSLNKLVSIMSFCCMSLEEGEIAWPQANFTMLLREQLLFINLYSSMGVHQHVYLIHLSLWYFLKLLILIT